jgi:hypothetical protein
VHDEQLIPPPPALFQGWKHHARFVCAHVRRLSAGGPAALSQLPANLLAIGGSQMDLYLGPLSPAAIAGALIDHLAAADRLHPDRYRAALADSGGYLVVDLADRSSWVLRWGDQPGRYVHIHPARYAPQTLRVRAPVLKTALAALAWAAAHGVELDLAAVNAARAALLGWQPLKTLDADAGCGALLADLAALLDEETGSQDSGFRSQDSEVG